MTDQISPPERPKMAQLNQSQIGQLLDDYRNRYVLHTVPRPDAAHQLNAGAGRGTLPHVVQVLPVL
jgi:hypothetical protein